MLTITTTLRGDPCEEAMSKTSRLPGLLANVLLISVFCVSIGEAQQDQRELSRQLLEGNRVERSRALETVSGLSRLQVSPELRGALITLLARNNRIVADAAARNQALATFEDPEFVTRVAHVVSQLDHPQAIPALAGALGTGSTLVPDALADFGEPAVPAVLAVVTSPTSHYSAVDDGLIALRFMVEGAGPKPLSKRSLDQIRAAARERLTGTEYFTTLWRAIDLAVVLNDAGLRHIVQSLASDTGEVIARGVTDAALITKTQERAAQRLTGGRSLPRHRSLTERDQLLKPPSIR